MTTSKTGETGETNNINKIERGFGGYIGGFAGDTGQDEKAAGGASEGKRARAFEKDEIERLWSLAPVHLRVLVDREIGRLRAIIRVNGLRNGASHADIDEVING